MSSIVEVCNQAISRIGSGAFITDIDAVDNQESIVCKLFYESARKQVLRAFEWPFATVADFALALVEENPTTEWGYSYQYPSDCLYFRGIHNPNTRFDLPENRISFRIVKNPLSSGRLIYTNLANATCEYTADFDEAEFFPDDFASALSWKLGASIAPSLAREAAPNAAKNAMQMFQYEIGIAQSNAANEDNGDEDQKRVGQESEFIRARS